MRSSHNLGATMRQPSGSLPPRGATDISRSLRGSTLPARSTVAGTRSQRAERPERFLPPQETLEDDYVWNLQQQVHFLEMEGSLLRQKLAQPGPRQKEKAVEANPTDDAALDAARPLDDHIRSLKLKYVEQAEAAKAEAHAIKQQNDDLRTRAAADARRIAELEQVRAQLVDASERAAGDRAEERAALFTEAEAERGVIADRDRVIAQLRRDAEDESSRFRQSQERVAALNLQVAQLRDDLAAARKGATSVSAAERREKELSELSVQISSLTDRAEAAEATAAASAAKEKEEREARWAAEGRADESGAEVRKLTRIIETLNVEMAAVRDQLTAARAEADSAVSTADRLQTAVDTLRREKQQRGEGDRVELELARRAARDSVESEASAREQLAACRADVEALQQEVAESRSETGSVRGELSAAEGALSAAQQGLLALRVDLRSAAAQKEEDDSIIADLRGRLAAAQETNLQLAAEMDVLREKAAIKGDLDTIKLEEFEHLRQTNIELATVIQTLTQRFSNLGTAGADVLRTGGTLTPTTRNQLAFNTMRSSGSPHSSAPVLELADSDRAGPRGRSLSPHRFSPPPIEGYASSIAGSLRQPAEDFDDDLADDPRQSQTPEPAAFRPVGRSGSSASLSRERVAGRTTGSRPASAASRRSDDATARVRPSSRTTMDLAAGLSGVSALVSPRSDARSVSRAPSASDMR
jgi:hypothetical protein